MTRAIIVLALIMFLVACNSPDEEWQDESTADTSPINSIKGTWTSNCYLKPDNTGYQKNSVTFSDTDFGRVRYNYHIDNVTNCVTVAYTATDNYTGLEYTETPTTYSNGSTGWRVKGALGTHYLNSNTTLNTSTFNGSSYCGFNDWSDYVSRDRTGLVCGTCWAGQGDCAAKGSTVYFEFGVETTASGVLKLYLSDLKTHYWQGSVYGDIIYTKEQ